MELLRPRLGLGRFGFIIIILKSEGVATGEFWRSAGGDGELFCGEAVGHFQVVRWRKVLHMGVLMFSTMALGALPLRALRYLLRTRWFWERSRVLEALKRTDS